MDVYHKVNYLKMISQRGGGGWDGVENMYALVRVIVDIYLFKIR